MFQNNVRPSLRTLCLCPIGGPWIFGLVKIWCFWLLRCVTCFYIFPHFPYLISCKSLLSRVLLISKAFNTTCFLSASLVHHLTLPDIIYIQISSTTSPITCRSGFILNPRGYRPIMYSHWVEQFRYSTLLISVCPVHFSCSLCAAVPSSPACLSQPLPAYVVSAFLSFWQASRLRWNCSRTITSHRWIPSLCDNHQPLWQHDRAPGSYLNISYGEGIHYGGPDAQWHSPKSPNAEVFARPLQGPHAPSLSCARAPKSRHELAGSPSFAHATLSPIGGGQFLSKCCFSLLLCHDCWFIMAVRRDQNTRRNFWDNLLVLKSTATNDVQPNHVDMTAT